MKKRNFDYTIVTKNTSILLLMVFIATSGCKKEDTSEPEKAPALPPESTMIMNFSDFTNVDTTAYKSVESYQNWGRAASHVLVWNTVLTVTLAIPVASFREAFKHQAVYDPGLNAWVWSYNFTAGGDVHLAELHGISMPDGVQWEMYITKDSGYTDFLWYSGTSDAANESGTWILNANPDNPNPFLLIEWNRNLTNGNFDIKYTNIAAQNPNNGSYILYGKTSELMDAFYTIYNSSEINFVKINWSRASIFGQIKDPAFFEDDFFHCWDETRMDANCN